MCEAFADSPGATRCSLAKQGAAQWEGWPSSWNCFTEVTHLLNACYCSSAPQGFILKWVCRSTATVHEHRWFMRVLKS